MRQGRLEVQLLRWQETSSGGATITLQLADADDLEPFKLMTLAKRGMVGQILDIAWREVDPDNPEPHGDGTIAMRAGSVTGRTIGPLCLLAVRWCKLEEFQSWLSTAYKDRWIEVRDHGDAETVAKLVLCSVCEVDSRTQLDTDDEAAARFHERIRAPFRFIAEAIGVTHGDR